MSKECHFSTDVEAKCFPMRNLQVTFFKNPRKFDMWWDTNKKARYDRNFCGTLVNVFYFFILLTELVLWIKVDSFSDILSTSSHVF